jgi:hypothetical protein
MIGDHVIRWHDHHRSLGIDLSHHRRSESDTGSRITFTRFTHHILAWQIWQLLPDGIAENPVRHDQLTFSRHQVAEPINRRLQHGPITRQG